MEAVDVTWLVVVVVVVGVLLTGRRFDARERTSQQMHN